MYLIVNDTLPSFQIHLVPLNLYPVMMSLYMRSSPNLQQFHHIEDYVFCKDHTLKSKHKYGKK